MSKDDENPFVLEGTLLMDAIPVMSKKGLGIISIVNSGMELKGIITDGDLRRIIEKRTDIYSEIVDNVMVKAPKRIVPEKLAIEALHFIKRNSINNLPVVDNETCRYNYMAANY